jgi:hypothetical protein
MFRPVLWPPQTILPAVHTQLVQRDGMLTAKYIPNWHNHILPYFNESFKKIL